VLSGIKNDYTAESTHPLINPRGLTLSIFKNVARRMK